MKAKKKANRHNPFTVDIIYAFLDVTDGMKPHDYFSHMGGTKERADEVSRIRAEAFEMFGKAWLNSKGENS